MIGDILAAIAGALFALFIPGFLLTLVLYEEKRGLERILYSVMFSIVITVLTGIALGYNRTVAEITGGLTPENVWLASMSVSAVIGIAAVIKLAIKNGMAQKTPRK